MAVDDVLRAVRERQVDREFIAQATLDVTTRPRMNSLPWRGQFTPGLPSALLQAHSPNGIVLDPFVGSGTTLGESIRLGMPSIGAEINPAAFSLASVYELASLEQDVRVELTKSTGVAIQKLVLASSAGLTGSVHDPAPDLLELIASATDANLKKLLVACFVLALGNGSATTAERLGKAWRQICELLDSFPAVATEASVVTEDARQLSTADESVGMVLTSPPYINVFNYHQNYRPAVELLGWDVLPAARTEIGSNRKHRGNRFMTVVQYALDMAMTLDEMARVCRPGSPIVFVVGRESRVRGVPFPNGDILSALVEVSPSLRFERWQERSFTSRFGGRIFEEILTFRREDGAVGIPNVTAREVGISLLRENLAKELPEVGESVFAEIEDAIGRAVHIEPSPPLELLQRGILTHA